MDGYDKMLESGASNASQSERQLLTIARSIVADPEIMILAEKGRPGRTPPHQGMRARF